MYFVKVALPSAWTKGTANLFVSVWLGLVRQPKNMRRNHLNNNRLQILSYYVFMRANSIIFSDIFLSDYRTFDRSITTLVHIRSRCIQAQLQLSNYILPELESAYY